MIPLGACAGFAVIAACTVFDGLVVHDQADASNPDPMDVLMQQTDTASEGGPTPLFYLQVPDAVKACSLVQRCQPLAPSMTISTGVPVDPTNYSLCVDWLAGPVPSTRVGFSFQQQIYQCVVGQSTCAGAGSCMSLEEFAPGDPRCQGLPLEDAAPDGDPTEHCADDGGTILRCSGNYALHCGASYYPPGSRCLRGDDGVHWCATAQHCNNASSCLGSLLDYCGFPGNLHEGQNCLVAGYSCGFDMEAGTVNCLTGSVAKYCTNEGTTDCSGNAVQVCDGYNLTEFDCAAMNTSCDAKKGPARCVRPGDTCTPFDTAINQCSANTISLCVGGQRTDFDCSSVGLQCLPQMGSQSSHCG